MNKSLMRAAMVACLPFFAMALTVASTPAQAADKAETPKVSKSVSKPISECQKALIAKDYPTAIAKCEEAKAVADTTDYDKYLINRFLGVAYFGTDQRAKAEEAFVAVVKNPATPTEDRQNLIGPALSLASEANNMPLVLELADIALKDPITNPDIYGTIAQAYYQTNDLQKAIQYAQKGIELADTQGKVPQYAMLQIFTFAYDKLKDRPNEIKGLTMMARDYGQPEDWKYLLDFSLEFLPKGNKNAAEIAALDLYRLRVVVGADWAASNYLEAADAAHGVRSWGDALEVLNMGIAKGVIDSKKVAPLLNQTKADAAKDRPILGTVEKSAKDSKSLANVAEAYYGYGQYDDAIRVGQKAVAAGGAGAAEAKLVVAMAQVRKGDETGAKATLATFSGDPALARAAELWGVYLNRRYGDKAPVAPAAPAAH